MLLILLALACPSGIHHPPRTNHTDAPCPLDTVPQEERDGSRRLALVIGVSEYAQDFTGQDGVRLEDLVGPRDDVDAIKRLLSEPGGLGVPAQNVCVLQDQDATLADVEAAIEQRLIAHARPGDQVILYFSGHGTRLPDSGGDEDDGLDGALLLHDAGTDGGGLLVDDTLNRYLSVLHDQMSGGVSLPDMLLIVDACFAGTASRGTPPAASGLTSRLASLAPDLLAASPPAEPWVPRSLDGLVVLSASQDDTVAWESTDIPGGVFTASLVRVFAEEANNTDGTDTTPALTWEQVARRVSLAVDAQLVALQGSLQAQGRLTAGPVTQRPAYEGPLQRRVFGGAHTIRTTWTVFGGDAQQKDAQDLELRGFDLQGWGVGAVVAILPQDTTLAALDGGQTRPIHATVYAYDPAVPSARVRLPSSPPFSPTEGDKVMLLKPSEDALTLPVWLSPSLPPDVAAALRAALADAIGLSLATTAAAGALRVEPEADALLIRDASGNLRNRAADAKDIARHLQRHAQQHALLALSALNPQGQLQLQAVPYPRYPCCTEADWWMPCPGSDEQILPSCSLWQVEVRNASGRGYQVGGAMLWSDGCIQAFPDSRERVVLRAGTTIRLEPGWAFLAEGQRAVPHQLLVFGTPVDAPMATPWDLLGTDCDSDPTPLDDRAVESDWTVAHLSLRVSPNPHLEPDTCPDRFCPHSCASSICAETCSTAEPVLQLEPYLPEAPHPLRAVLLAADPAGGDPAVLLASVAGLPALEALPRCAEGPPRAGDVLRRGDAATTKTTLLVDPTLSLIWGDAGFVRQPPGEITDCRRPDWPPPTYAPLDCATLLGESP